MSLVEFVERRGREDADVYFKYIRAHRSEKIAENALKNEDYHVNRGVDWLSQDFRHDVNAKHRRIYKAVFGQTLRELLWDVARDRILEKEERMELMEYHADP